MSHILLLWDDEITASDKNKSKPRITHLPTNKKQFPAKAFCVSLQADTQSSLDWSEQIAKAETAKNEGMGLVWDIQLGLFDNLYQPISSRSQLLSLQLALDQFDEKIWQHFCDDTYGIFLYRDSLQFADVLPWDKTIENNFKEWSIKNFPEHSNLAKEGPIANAFSANVAIDYFHLLLPHLPEEAETFLLFEAGQKQTLLEEAYLLNQERYGILHPLSIDSKHKYLNESATVGVCLPCVEECLPEHHLSLQAVFERLNNLHIPYRIIPEEQLTGKWDGLDEIIVEKDAVCSQTKRKLQGFAAAGGKTITLGNSPIGIVEEEFFDSWEKILQLNI